MKQTQEYIEVALPLPIRKNFTYSVSLDVTVDIGMRVMVPFGKKVLTGIIVKIRTESVPKCKAIIEVLDTKPIFSSTLLALTQWIAEYYFASWGETLFAALPQGMSPSTIVTIELLQRFSDEELFVMQRTSPKRVALLRVLQNHKGPLTTKYLQKVLSTETITQQLLALEFNGSVRIHRDIDNKIQAKMQKAIRVAPELLENENVLKDVLQQLDTSSPKQAQVLSLALFFHYHTENAVSRASQHLLFTSLHKQAKVSPSVVTALVEKTFLVEYMAEVLRTNSDETNSTPLSNVQEIALALTMEQQSVTNTIVESLENNNTQTFLLHGVTGSGKTLVYMHILDYVIKKGKSGLILVPEISLTPQLIDRFRASFGNTIAVLHSRMSDGERYDTWREIQSGEARIVIGTRSALFAPLESLGIIIVDEEHEQSYKQDSPSPRYNARDGAVIRAMMEKIPIVLGSATPSLESYYNAQIGKYTLLRISERADNAKLPDVAIIDIVDVRKRKLLQGAYSQELIDAIIQRVEKKEGVLLLQNRRGYAPRLECLDCGDIPQCYQCDVPLTYHKYQNQLRCHYCGWTKPAENCCTVCGSTSRNELGIGTQRAEEELVELLASKNIVATIERVDTDTIQKRGSLRSILSRFKAGAIDILIGTQIIAKGLDFERVTLVGVINADIQLQLPDFRASERTFQLLTQVAGRAGRSNDKPGSVLIQTSKPTHRAIVQSMNASFHEFYTEELQDRREANYPPYSRFVVIEFSGLDWSLVERHAQAFMSLLNSSERAYQILGPSKPSIDRIKNKFRRHIIIKGHKVYDPTAGILRENITNAVSYYSQKFASSNVAMKIDIDAFSTL